MFDEENRARAERYVEKYFSEMKEKLECDDYFVYDEYETIYIHAGRFIPDILNDKMNLSGDDALSAVEEMIVGEGNCGIIVRRSMLGDKERIVEILTKFYKNKLLC